MDSQIFTNMERVKMLRILSTNYNTHFIYGKKILATAWNF